MSQKEEAQGRKESQNHNDNRRRLRGARILVPCAAGVVLVGLLGVVAIVSRTPAGEGGEYPDACIPPAPEPGFARPWEAEISISTYSTLNTHHGNVVTAIPITGWMGAGPDIDFVL